jgi:hypothetical protein
MKYFRKPVLLAALASLGFVATGCFGKYQLTRNFYQWHDSTFENKFVKSLLLWIPFGFVYGITVFADTLIFNLIEFWSGSNPLSMKAGESEVEYHTYAGQQYEVEVTRNQYKMTALTGDHAGEVTVVRFDELTRSWVYQDAQTEVTLMQFNEANGEEMVTIYASNGEAVTFTASELNSKEVVEARMGLKNRASFLAVR